jgi:hypothetical protein
MFAYQRRIGQFNANTRKCQDIPTAIDTQLGKRRLLV